MSKSGVDGVYDADPRTNSAAKKLDKVTYQERCGRAQGRRCDLL